ncbi:unknown protein [Microcystis aeruginosa NIES-843]|uniref:Uncharacterized protein n=1 Tax=Microcystis aeruginosa (strain NIES-843 / IAM M-2473) TaxID=449447 RepID=B0JXK7_MICAN|nr:unknown protein [Microcystis aeruginosa NIES-843]
MSILKIFYLTSAIFLLPLSLDWFCIYLSVPLNLDVRISTLFWAFYLLVLTLLMILNPVIKD